jgi:hypothetical protein
VPVIEALGVQCVLRHNSNHPNRTRGYKMKAIGYFTFLFLTMSLISCSIGGSDGGRAAVSAPSTLTGKAYLLTVESGSGVFTKTGTFTVVFSSSQPTYTSQGDGVNFGDSGGIYIYSSSGDSGTVKTNDSVVSKVVYSFTFNTASSGTYVATATSGVNSNQLGTFSGTFIER